LVSGYKDRDGKFHPIQQYRRKSSRVRYANDSGLSQLAGQAVKDFAILNRDRYNSWKVDQDKKFQEELVLRRKFRVPLIRAFRLARAQEITKPKELEKFIRQNIPDLPKGKKTNRFVEKVLKEFIKEERRFKEKLEGKPEEEKKKLEDSFEMALTESEKVFNKIVAERDDKFALMEKKDKEKWVKKIEKLEKETKQARDSEKEHQKDADALRQRLEKGESQSIIKTAIQTEQKSENKEEKEQKDETSFASQVFEELAEAQQAPETTDFEFGFPSEII